MTAEHDRLKDCRQQHAPWKKWGPYLSERQWGTVREDYSEDGNAWVIMGVVRKAIQQTFGEGWKDEADRAGKRMRSGDYAHLLEVAREYIDIADHTTGRLEFIEEET